VYPEFVQEAFFIFRLLCKERTLSVVEKPRRCWVTRMQVISCLNALQVARASEFTFKFVSLHESLHAME